MANRITIIIATSDTAQWQYIHTSQNPADDASRGLMLPHYKAGTPIAADDPEVKMETFTNALKNWSDTTQLIIYHSSWKRLRSAVAWILKVKKALLELSWKRKQILLDDHIDLNHISQEMLKTRFPVAQELSTDDLSMAENAIITFCQKRNLTVKYLNCYLTIWKKK